VPAADVDRRTRRSAPDLGSARSGCREGFGLKTRTEPASIFAARPNGPWIYGPWLDLIVGCGAWSAPLLAAALWLTRSHTHAWVVAFYLLALAFNYPHFMATVYRAYHTRADFEKYKIFTLHITLLLVLPVFCFMRPIGCSPGCSRFTSAGAHGITPAKITD
jgi:hypothetical protein